MPYNSLNSLHYGIKDGKLFHVSEVTRGLSCGCVCPACGAALIARQGQKREHHFAHASGDPCRYASETALHLAAKEILARRKEIVLPAVEANFYGTTIEVAPEKRYRLDSTTLERRVANVVPDVLAHVDGRSLHIEVRVTHEVDECKLARIQQLGVSAIEIDLSDKPRDLPPIDLETFVVEAGPHKHWVHNVVAARVRSRIISEATIRPFVQRGFATHVDGCPLPARRWKGKPYANVMDDCSGCEHALEFGDQSVTCGA